MLLFLFRFDLLRCFCHVCRALLIKGETNRGSITGAVSRNGMIILYVCMLVYLYIRIVDLTRSWSAGDHSKELAVPLEGNSNISVEIWLFLLK